MMALRHGLLDCLILVRDHDDRQYFKDDALSCYHSKIASLPKSWKTVISRNFTTPEKRLVYAIQKFANERSRFKKM